MIVGIDPGTTIAFAVIDLDGNVVRVESFRNKPVDEIVKELSPYSPAVIASDVTPPPETVRKISASFDATLFSPEEPLLVSEKNRMAKRYKLSNDHERDALSAALYAYSWFSPKIRKAKKLAREKQEEIVRASLGKVRLSDVVSSATSIPSEKPREETSKLRKELGLEKKKSKELERQLGKLKVQLSAARKRISRLEAVLPAPKPVEPEPEVQVQRELSSGEVEELFKEYKKKL